MPALVAVLLVVLLITAVIVIVYCRIRIRILRVRLRAEMYNKAEIANFLNLFSRNIQKMDNAENWMNVTARYVADLVEAQSVCIFVLDPETNRLKASGIVGAFPSLHPVTATDGSKPKYTLEAIRRERIAVGDENNIAGMVAATMNPVFIDASNDPRIAGLEAVDPVTTLMAVPMIYEGKCTGVICAVENRRSPDNPFETDQFNRMKFIAGQIVLAQNILAAYSNLGKQQRLNQELDFARSLQSSLLPESFPDWGNFRIHAFTRASKEVSGDFYDYVEIDENRSLVVIGDACGKGIPACMIMAMTRSFIRANINRFTTLKNLLIELNENLYRDTGDGRYITLGICLLNKKESTLEYARAGHTELLIYVRNHIRTINPDGAGLGLLPSELADFDTFCIEFTKDMEIMMFTDGINEAVSPFGEQFGVERIKENFTRTCLAKEMPETSTRRLMAAVDDFTERSTDQADDQTVVIIRHL